MTCVPPKTPAERAAMEARLAKLEVFYDQIIGGQGVKRFEDQNGEKIEYNTGNASQLKLTINALRSCLDTGFARYYKPKPMGFVFPRQ